MNKKKKIAFAIGMGGLTSIAVTGCVWQLKRYHQSIHRWETIIDQIDNFNPVKIQEIPWTLDTIKEHQYKLVEIEGNFHESKYALVNRMSNARMGYFLVRPFTQKDNQFNIIVNCGWICEEMKNDVFELKESMQKGVVIGIVKRDENLEIKRSKRMYPKSDDLFNLIDLNQLSDHFQMDVSGGKGGFIDLITNEQSGDNEEALYPVTPTQKNFQKPYLTPRKHVEYATFWGGAATIGFLSIVRVLLL